MMPVKKLAIIVGRFMLQQKGVCSQWDELLIVQADKRELTFPTTKLATYVHRQSSVQKTHTLLSNVAQKNLGPSQLCQLCQYTPQFIRVNPGSYFKEGISLLISGSQCFPSFWA
jgi:hypothetical protein